MILIVLGATVILQSLTASAALAAPPNPLALAERAAESYWGNVPCAGQIAVNWRTSTLAPSIPGTVVEAWVNFETPSGPLDYAAASSTYSGCTININSAVWPSYAATVEAYPQFCQMIVHEFGHFEGYIDSTSYPSSDIRYPLMSPDNLPSVCKYDISAGTGLYPNGFPPLPGLSKTATRALASRQKVHCFEVRCEVVRRLPGRARHPQKI